MPSTLTVTKTVSFLGGEQTFSANVSGDSEVVLDKHPIAADSADLLVDIVDIAIAKVQGIFIGCDQDITVKTNSSGAPDETIVLKAGVPFEWLTGKSAHPNLFGTNLTALYVTSDTAGVAAELTLRVVVNT